METQIENMSRKKRTDNSERISNPKYIEEVDFTDKTNRIERIFILVSGLNTLFMERYNQYYTFYSDSKVMDGKIIKVISDKMREIKFDLVEIESYKNITLIFKGE